MTRVQRQLPMDGEQKVWNEGCLPVGIDEVGRGCLAGPVVIAGVAFPQEHAPHFLVRDSKKLSQKQRLEAFEYIQDTATQISVVLMDVEHIDEVNILEATRDGMVGVAQTFEKHAYFYIDGNDCPLELQNSSYETVIKGDGSIYSIAAASIVAKVVRDQIIEELHHQFPQYDWYSNKGYGTKVHREALKKYGPCRYHRQKFIRKILET